MFTPEQIEAAAAVPVLADTLVTDGELSTTALAGVRIAVWPCLDGFGIGIDAVDGDDAIGGILPMAAAERLHHSIGVAIKAARGMRGGRVIEIKAAPPPGRG